MPPPRRGCTRFVGACHACSHHSITHKYSSTHLMLTSPPFTRSRSEGGRRCDQNGHNPAIHGGGAPQWVPMGRPGRGRPRDDDEIWRNTRQSQDAGCAHHASRAMACTGSGEYTAASAARACEHSAVGPALSERRRRRVGGAVGPPLAPRGVVWREAYVQPFVATWGVTGCLRDLFDRGSVRFVRGSVAGGSVDPGFELRLRAELPLEFRS